MSPTLEQQVKDLTAEVQALRESVEAVPPGPVDGLDDAGRRAQTEALIVAQRESLALAIEHAEVVQYFADCTRGVHSAAQQLLAAANAALLEFTDEQIDAAVAELQKRRPREDAATRAVQQVAAKTETAKIRETEMLLAQDAARKFRAVTVDMAQARLDKYEADLAEMS